MLDIDISMTFTKLKAEGFSLAYRIKQSQSGCTSAISFSLNQINILIIWQSGMSAYSKTVWYFFEDLKILPSALRN